MKLKNEYLENMKLEVMKKKKEYKEMKLKFGSEKNATVFEIVNDIREKALSQIKKRDKIRVYMRQNEEYPDIVTVEKTIYKDNKLNKISYIRHGVKHYITHDYIRVEVENIGIYVKADLSLYEMLREYEKEINKELKGVE